jgi:hypothetical protein
MGKMPMPLQTTANSNLHHGTLHPVDFSSCLCALYVQKHEEKPDGATGSFREWGVQLVGGSFLWYDHFGIWRG